MKASASLAGIAATLSAVATPAVEAQPVYTQRGGEVIHGDGVSAFTRLAGADTVHWDSFADYQASPQSAKPGFPVFPVEQLPEVGPIVLKINGLVSPDRSNDPATMQQNEHYFVWVDRAAYVDHPSIPARIFDHPPSTREIIDALDPQLEGRKLDVSLFLSGAALTMAVISLKRSAGGRQSPENKS